MRRHSKNKIDKCANLQKHFHAQNNSAQVCKTQMHKSANVQKPSVHKMRKSAAQICFSNATFALFTNLHCAQFRLCKFSSNVQFPFCCKSFSAHKHILKI